MIRLYNDSKYSVMVMMTTAATVWKKTDNIVFSRHEMLNWLSLEMSPKSKRERAPETW